MVHGSSSTEVHVNVDHSKFPSVYAKCSTTYNKHALPILIFSSLSITLNRHIESFFFIKSISVITIFNQLPNPTITTVLILLSFVGFYYFHLMRFCNMLSPSHAIFRAYKCLLWMSFSCVDTISQYSSLTRDFLLCQLGIKSAF